MSQLSIIHQDRGLQVVVWDLLLGVRWYDLPTLDSIACYRDLQSRHIRLQGSGKKALVVSYSDASNERLQFDPGLREAVETTLAEGSTDLLGMAQVIVGGGFGAASVRSVLSGLQLSVRPPYPIRFFGDTSSAQGWLEELLLKIDRADLARQIGSAFLRQLELGSE